MVLFEYLLFVCFKKRDNSTISNIIPGDFDGDSVMDLLVVSQKNSATEYKMSFFRGTKSVARYINDLGKVT